MSDHDIEITHAAIRSWNEGDRAGFLAAFHPEGQWSSAIKRQVEGGDGLYRGREEIERFWDEWHAVWEGLNIIVSEIRSPRDGCVFAFGGLQATGSGSRVGLERPFGWVLLLEDGLIREVSAYLSRDEALEAAGLTE
jgi:ketosteroid isomerase-like protein